MKSVNKKIISMIMCVVLVISAAAGDNAFAQTVSKGKAAESGDAGVDTDASGAIASNSDEADVIEDKTLKRDYEYEKALDEAEEESEEGYLLTAVKGDYLVKSSDLTYSASASSSSYNSVNYDSSFASSYPTTRDQGSYGNCWAYGTLASVEFSLVSQGMASSSVDLNELLLSYFAYNTAQDPLGGTLGDTASWTKSSNASNVFEIGGNYFYAAALLTRWVGAANESTYSDYSTAVSSGVDTSYAYNYDAYHINDAYYLSMTMNDYDTANIAKQMIVKYGAVGTTIYISSSNYYYNSTNNCYYFMKAGSDISANHGVSVVGWDDDFPASNFNSNNRPSSNGAWLVRNSWSDTSSADIGSYFWVSYEDASLGYYSSYASDKRMFYVYLADSDSHDNNYQYDGSSIADCSGYTTAANVFTASSGSSYEYLDKVSFAVEDADSSYDIKVYTNVEEEGSPDSGILACEVSGTQAYAGYTSVDLGRTIQLVNGERFSVIVTTSSSYGIDAEYGYTGANFDFRVTVPNYSSYYYTGGVWHKVAVTSDATGYGNFSIKAFTKNSKTPLSTAPTGMTVEADSVNPSTTLNASWTAPSSLSSSDLYEIYRSSDTASSGFEKLGDLSVGASSYSDSTLSGGTTATYLVRTVDADTGNVAVCYASGTTSVGVPAITTLLNKTSGVYLAWNAVSGADYYILQRYKSAGSWETLSSSLTGLFCTDTTASSGNVCIYRLAAVAGDTESTWSSTVSIVRLSTPALTVKNTAKALKLSWTQAKGATSYRIYRKKASASSWTLLASKGSSVNQYSDKKAKNGQRYIYYVQAVYTDASTGAITYGALETTGTSYVRLTRPVIKSAKRLTGGTKALIKWKKKSGVTGYQIKVKTGSKTYTYTVKGASKTQKTVKKLKKNKTAKIYVRSYKKVGGVKYYSAWSAVKKVK